MLGLLLSACAPGSTTPTALPSEAATSTSTPASMTPIIATGGDALWINPAVPDALREATKAWSLPTVDDASAATVNLTVGSGSESGGSQWIYALVAPFATVLDGVTSDQLQAEWKGSSSE